MGAVDAFSSRPYYVRDANPEVPAIAAMTMDDETKTSDMSIMTSNVDGAAQDYNEDLAKTMAAILNYQSTALKRRKSRNQPQQITGRVIVTDPTPRPPPRSVEGAASSAEEDFSKTLQVICHKEDLDRTLAVLKAALKVAQR